MQDSNQLAGNIRSFARTRSGKGFGFILLLLAVANVAFEKTSGAVHILLIACGYIGLYAVFRFSTLTRANIGLARRDIVHGVRMALYVITPMLVVFSLAYIIDPQLFRDPRYDNTLPEALFSALIVLPLQVVLFEELAFRGIMLAQLHTSKFPAWMPIFVTSLLFGLWHIMSSQTIGNYNIGDSIVIPLPIVVAGVLVATTAAGVVLALLRIKSRSLLAPILVHWCINGSAILFAALAWR